MARQWSGARCGGRRATAPGATRARDCLKASLRVGVKSCFSLTPRRVIAKKRAARGQSAVPLDAADAAAASLRGPGAAGQGVVRALAAPLGERPKQCAGAQATRARWAPAGQLPHPPCMGHKFESARWPSQCPGGNPPWQPRRDTASQAPRQGSPFKEKRRRFHAVPAGAESHSLVLHQGGWRRLILVFLVLRGVVESSQYS